MNSDLITVIVPVYNTEKYLNRCVRSICAQTYSNIEIILVDDGSPDGAGALCDRLSQEDRRIRVIHKVNGGLSSARNAGLDCACGNFVCFVDSDDYIEKDYVQTLYGLMRQYQSDIVKIDYAEVYVDDYSASSGSAPEQFFCGKDVEKAFLQLKVDSACVFLYKKELIGETRFPVGKTSEDIFFNFEIFQKARTFVYAPVKKYYYYYNPKSISNGSLNRNMFNYLDIRERIYSFYKENNNNELERLSEVLYARAAMGLLSRMALYGISDELNEKNEYKHLRGILKEHKKVFFSAHEIPLSRKLLGFACLYAYGFLKIIGRIKR